MFVSPSEYPFSNSDVFSMCFSRMCLLIPKGSHCLRRNVHCRTNMRDWVNNSGYGRDKGGNQFSCRVRGVSASHLHALAHMFDVEWLPGHWGTRICWSCKSKGPTVRLSGCTLPARWSKAVRWPDWMLRFGPPGAHRAASPTDGAAPLGRPRPAGDTPFCPEWICAVA